MLLGRALAIASFIGIVACGGRAIVEADGSADAGVSAPENTCGAELATFSASATLIDQELDRPCTTDRDCATKALQTHCIYTCLATAGAVLTYAHALTSTSEQCLDCAAPPTLDPCAYTIPTCERGRCFAAPVDERL